MAKEPTPRVQTKKHLARLERERIQRRYLLIGTGVVVALILAIVLYGVLDQLVFQSMRTVAKVGNETINAGEFQKEVRYTRSRMIDELIQYTSNPMYMQFMGSYLLQMQSQLANKEALGQQVLDSMIEDILVAREAEERGITISDEEVNQRFEEAFGFYENGTPTPENTATPFVFSTSTLSPLQMTLVPPTATAAPTGETADTTPPAEATPEGTAEATAPAAVEPTAEVQTTPDATATSLALTPSPTPTITLTPTPYTREGFETQVSQFVSSLEGTGYTRNDLRDLIRRQMLKQKVYDAITADVATTSEQIWVRHILVPDLTIAEVVLERLNAGEDFAALAQELSQDEGSKNNGGQYDWFSRGTMVVPFEEVAFNLEIGEISEPVKTDYGYHVIQLLGKEERPVVEDQLQNVKDQAYQDWLDQAKTEANVVLEDETWRAVVPDEPVVPAEVNAILNQVMQQQQQQALPEDLILPTDNPDTGITPEPVEPEQQ